MGTPALALLEWDLLGSVLEGLSKTLAPGGALDRGLSEKGAPCWCFVPYAIAEEDVLLRLQTSLQRHIFQLLLACQDFSIEVSSCFQRSLPHRAHEPSRCSSYCRDAAAAVRRALPARRAGRRPTPQGGHRARQVRRG